MTWVIKLDGRWYLQSDVPYGGAWTLERKYARRFTSLEGACADLERGRQANGCSRRMRVVRLVPPSPEKEIARHANALRRVICTMPEGLDRKDALLLLEGVERAATRGRS